LANLIAHNGFEEFSSSHCAKDKWFVVNGYYLFSRDELYAVHDKNINSENNINKSSSFDEWMMMMMIFKSSGVN
jgi:hypothetical protein